MDINKKADAIVAAFKTTYDSDSVDRLKYVHSIRVLIIFAIYTFTQSYIAPPVQCWVPNQFEDAWEQYLESFCFIEGSYFVNMNKTSLPGTDERTPMNIRYYQWIPFVFLVIALGIYIPRMIWKSLLTVCDIDVSIATTEMRQRSKCKGCERSQEIRSRNYVFWKTKAKDSYLDGRLMAIVIFSKFISCVMLVVEIILLQLYLSGNAFNYYGWNIISDVVHGIDWQRSGVFPRVTFCDLQVRELGQIHNWSVQCVLANNMMNEKLFVIVWWALLGLFVISILNLMVWIIRIMRQEAAVRRILKYIEVNDEVRKMNFSKFYDKLTTDDVTLLYLIELNSNTIEAAEFFSPIWMEINSKQL